MPLFILTETSAGYALLKARDKTLLDSDAVGPDPSAEQICSLLKLKDFQKFDSASAALEEVAALVEGKVTPKLASLLDSIKNEKKASLAVADPKLANAITKLPQLTLTAIADSKTQDLYRAIRAHLPSIVPGLLPDDIATMSLGLSHSLSRHKLKFSPDKVDTMIVQAIALLDDLDKELNTYAMRVKEWYGWHFPEMGRILNDNLAYARVVLKMGMRSSAATADLAEILPEEIEASVKAAAEVSMGTEITDEDLENIQALAEQVVEFTEYRQQLSGYLTARMAAVAPNLTALVGDLVGARLIAHAGSLMNLAKSPASTIQILGAEKALFRALKTKHDTPKYGLIYHASLIGQATGKNKGKIARVLAAKAAIGLRVDALADWTVKEGEEEVPEEERAALGTESRLKIERRLAGLEGRPLRAKGVAIAPNGVSNQPQKWEIKEARKYNPDADGLAGNEEAASAPSKGKGKKIIEEVEDTPMTGTKNGLIQDKKMKGADQMDEHEDSGAQDEDESMEEAGDILPSRAKSQDAKAPEHESEDEDEEDEDEEMESDPATAAPPAQSSTSNGLPSNGIDKPAATADGSHSPTLSTVSSDTPPSPDSPTAQEQNWQSAILGNTKVAKKARKKERHERRLALSESRSEDRKVRKEKEARRLDRRERRREKEAQLVRRAGQGGGDEELAGMAEKAGLSVVRYKRKLARGEIRFEEDGTPVAVSKKDVKRAKKEAEKAAAVEAVGEGSGKKRKRKDEEGEDGKRKKKKKEKREKKKSKHATEA